LIECPGTEKAVTCLPDNLKFLLQILFVGRSKLLGDIILFKLQGREVVLWASSLVEIQSHLDGSLWKPHRNNYEKRLKRWGKKASRYIAPLRVNFTNFRVDCNKKKMESSAAKLF